jgi:6-phosphogluconolactonase (cycloisomerase 2 family)
MREPVIEEAHVADTTRRLMAVGSYTPGGVATGGDGPAGLTTWWWDGATGLEPAGSADLASASFVCWHPTLPLLYAVSEIDDGLVTTLEVSEDGGLTEVDSTATGGAQPCWVTTDPTGGTLLIANYASGSIAVIGLDGAGRPVGGPMVVQHHGSGPVADRQEGPHAHQVVPTADGHVLASDLGIDRILEYRIDSPSTGADEAQRAGVTEVGSIQMPAGSGPRHIALAAGGRTGFVTGELDATVTVIRHETSDPAGAHWAATEHVSCSTRSGAQPSHLLLGGGDRWLLVANRGPDTLAVLEVADGLAIRHEVPVGAQPRHFVLEGDAVVVACQDSNELQLLTLNAEDGSLIPAGTLTADGTSSPLRTPACVAVRH